MRRISEYKIYIIIGCLTVLMGVFVININDQKKLSPDSIGYYNYGYNIASRELYTYKINGQEPNYFREPGYSFFVASGLKIYELFDKIKPIQNYDRSSKTTAIEYKEIIFLKYFQLILYIFTNIFLYKFFKLFNNLNISRLSILLVILYYPFMLYVNSLLREPLLTTFFTISIFYLVEYIKEGHCFRMCLSAFFLALSMLTFQVMLVFIPVYIIAILIFKKGLKAKIGNAFLLVVIITLTITPWIAKVYNYYPDFKIIKTLGCSLTYENLEYVKVLRKAERQKFITSAEKREIYSKYWFNMNTKEQFDRSFNGWYIVEANKLDAKLKSESFFTTIKIQLNKSLSYFILNTFKHNWNPLIFKEVKKDKDFIKLIPFGISIMVGLLSIFGIFFIGWKKRLYLSIHLIFYMGIIYTLGDELRRSLPFFPIIIYLALMGGVKIIKIVKHKRNDLMSTERILIK